MSHRHLRPRIFAGALVCAALALPVSTADASPAAPARVHVTASATTAAKIPPAIKIRHYAGTGDKVVRIQATTRTGIISFTHNGQSNFIVTPLSKSGEEGISLVNEIGAYRGTVVFNADFISTDIAALEIQADGHWTATVKPLAAATKWRSGRIAKGKGDQVLRLTPGVPARGIHTLTAAHTGQSNFIVTPILRSEEDISLVNEIGRYRGTVRLPNRTQYLVVQADGNWTFKRR